MGEVNQPPRMDRIEFTDGRIFWFKPWQLSKYILTDGRVSHRICSECNEKKDIKFFYTTYHKTGTTNVCRRCELEYQADYRTRIRAGEGRKSHFLELRYTTKDGLVGFECKHCGIWKDLSEYNESRKQVGRGKEYKTYKSSWCKDCHSAYGRSWAKKKKMAEYIGRCRERYGEGTAELNALQDEKQYDKFKVLCKMYGLREHRKVSDREKTHVWSVLYGMSNVGRKRRAEEAPKGQRGNTPVPVLEVQEVQVRD